MAFYARVFALKKDYPTRIEICDKLVENNFNFSTFPGKCDSDFDEKDWKHLMFQYDEINEPIRLERNIKERDRIFVEEQQEFLDALKKIPTSKEQGKAKEILENVVQTYAFDVDDDISEEGWDFLNFLLDFISDTTDGYVQIDNEGIYDKKGRILVEME